MSRQVVILVPVLNRPHRVWPTIESFEANTDRNAAELLFIASADDLPERRELEHQDAPHIILQYPVCPGDYARKINFGYHTTKHPWMFLGADDVKFHPAWLDNAMVHFNDEGIGVIGTQDLGNPRVRSFSHSTHSFVSRGYVDEWGTIDERGKVLHEGYPHEYVDDEFIETAKFRRAWKFAMHSIVEHLHPHWGKSETDSLYDQFDARMKIGSQVYMNRRHLWNLGVPRIA